MSEPGKPADPPPAQPTLRDGDVTLRPWRLSDVEPARPQQDDMTAHVFAIDHRGEVAGRVDVRQRGDGVGSLSWAVYPAHRGQGVATRALRLLVDYCFGELGLVRVQAAVEAGDLASLRTAGRAGLRREGVERSFGTTGDRRPDFVWVARLSSDPSPQSPEGFRGVLNAMLPTKRVIAQGLIRSDSGKLLLCELTYKREWDLPGGVVDPHESPSRALVREIEEELGLSLPLRRLRLVNWLPPWHGWDDACLFVFDLGVHGESLADGLALEPREIRAVHWCSADEAVYHVAPYLAGLLPYLLDDAAGPAYLEAGIP